MGVEGGKGKVTGGGAVSPLERDPWCPSRRGRRSSAPECALPLAQARVYFGSSAPCFFFFFRGSCSTPGSPSPNAVTWVQLKAPRLSPSQSGLPGAHGQYLSAVQTSGPCGRDPGPSNRTRETRLLAVRSGFCHLGTSLPTRASRFGVWLGALSPGLGCYAHCVLRVRSGLWSPGSGLPTAELCPSSGLCSLRSEH